MVFWGWGCASATSGFTPEHKAALADSVQAALREFSEAGAAGEWDRVAAMYADDPDFLWMEDGRVVYRSAAEVATALKQLASSMSDSELEWIEPSVIALAPGRAAIATRFEQSFTMAAGESFSFSGAISAVMINGPDGWQFLRGHSSSSERTAER